MQVISCVEAKTLGLKRFYTGRQCKHGHDSERIVSNGCCVRCLNNRVATMRKRERERHATNVREWARRNKDKIKAKRQVYLIEYGDEIREKRRAYNLANQEKIKAYKVKYNEKTKQMRNLKVREYNRCKRQTDLQWHLATSLRTRLNTAIRNGIKSGSAVHDLGCSILEFVSYIESMFHDGMTWKNRGKRLGQWQLDHIKPLASFDLTDRTQFLEACHYTNYQPLWIIDHHKKSVLDRLLIKTIKLAT